LRLIESLLLDSRHGRPAGSMANCNSPCYDGRCCTQQVDTQRPQLMNNRKPFWSATQPCGRHTSTCTTTPPPGYGQWYLRCGNVLSAGQENGSAPLFCRPYCHRRTIPLGRRSIFEHEREKDCHCKTPWTGHVRSTGTMNEPTCSWSRRSFWWVLWDGEFRFWRFFSQHVLLPVPSND
jgi:hypothetical protein